MGEGEEDSSRQAHRFDKMKTWLSSWMGIVSLQVAAFIFCTWGLRFIDLVIKFILAHERAIAVCVFVLAVMAVIFYAMCCHAIEKSHEYYCRKVKGVGDQ